MATSGDRAQGRLTGWKAIAAFLSVDVRTARRWEGERGLPVHRLPGDSRSPVWADPAELRQWMAAPPRDEPLPASSEAAARDGIAAPITPTPAGRRRWVAPALGVGLLLAGGGTLLLFDRPPATAPVRATAFADPDSNRLWRQATHARASRTPAGLDEAAAAFAELARRHPGDPAPQVGLAETYLLMREFSGLADEAAFRRARDAAEAALRAAPDDPAALRALGFVLFWSEADKPRGLALLARAAGVPDPEARSLHWYANALAFDGQIERALDLIGRARDRAPDSSAIAADEAQIRFILGEKRDALDALAAITRADPAFIGAWRYLEWNRLSEGDLPGFLEAARAQARLRGDAARLALLERAEAAAGRGGKPALLKVLAEDAEARHRSTGTDAIAVARLHALAGDRAATRRWIERAQALNEPFAHMLDGWPELRPLKDDPALADLFRHQPA
ncbi:MAG: tetratricopeptide repeat protein [Sphingomonadaceae bacterium]